MSTNTQLSIGLQSSEDVSSSPCDATHPDNSLTLEPIEPRDDLTMNDIVQMYALARSGVSARTYKPSYTQKIRIGPTFVRFTIDFYVWTVPLELPYELSTSQGTIGSAINVSELQDFSAVFPLSRGVSLGKPVKNLSYEWKTPLFDASGRVQAVFPHIKYKNGTLCIDKPYFGEARVRFNREGHKHTVTCEITNVDNEGNHLQVTDINITITARWENSQGETEVTTLKLPISDAIKSAFEICGGQNTLICQGCGGGGEDGEGSVIADVYYNTCTGKVLDVNKTDLSKDSANDKWCLPASTE